MKPSIGRSLREGFRATNGGLIGMACYVGAWTPVIVLALIGFLMTNPPQELFEELEQPQAVVSPTPALQQPPASVQPGTSPKPQPGNTIFDRLATAESEGTQPKIGQADAAIQPDSEQARQHRRIIEQWFSRAWPVLLLLAIFVVAANAWIAAGQLGYLHKRLGGGVANASDFWTSAASAFGPLLAAGMFAFLMALAGLMVYGLAALVFGGLASVLPASLLTVGGLIFVLASFVALLWLGVRLALWFIAIVVDRLGPLAGLKAGFAATRGRWWRVFGLLLVFGAIGFGAWLSFLVLMVILAAGGVIGAFFAIAAAIGYLFLTQVYIAFASAGAAIRFYLDAKPSDTQAAQ